MSHLTNVEIVDGQIHIKPTGPDGPCEFVRVKIPCRMSAGYARDCGVPDYVFSAGENGLATVFCKALLLELQLDFAAQRTTFSETDKKLEMEKTGALGDWIKKMIGLALALPFPFACDVYVALTDEVACELDVSGEVVAVSESFGRTDDPTMAVLAHKGQLVHVGVTA